MVIDRKGDTALFYFPPRCEENFSRDLFKELLKDHYKDVSKLVFDFKDTRFIDSSTIGVLVAIDRKIKSGKVSISLRNMNKDMMRLFNDTGLNALFNIEVNESVNKASTDLFMENHDIRLNIDLEKKDDVCIFHMSGIFDHPVGAQYFKQQVLLTISGHKKILLDFENITLFDSLSVSVVLSMYKLLTETGGSIRFCKANYLVNDLFSSLNIDKIIPVFKTIDDALADWE